MQSSDPLGPQAVGAAQWMRKKWVAGKRLLRFGAQRPRHRYRAVWNEASITEWDAMVSVMGVADEEGFRLAAHSTLSTLERSVGVQATDTILEIGCGIGRVGAVLAPRCHQWIGVDVADNMLRHASRRLAHLPNVSLRRGSGFDLAEIASDAVDLVYCTVVFMHLEEWDRFNYVREAYRVLRPGGRLWVDNVNLLSDAGWSFFLDHLETYEPHARPPQISKTSTPQELRAYFEHAGFGDIQQEQRERWIISYGRKPIPSSK